MILVLAGTSDGRTIVRTLLSKGHEVVVSTATAYGGKLMQAEPGLQINSQRLDHSEMEALIKEKSVECVVDATHPYARVVSETAMDVCEALGIPYWRYEREKIDYSEFPGVISCSGYKEVVDYLNQHAGNVLMTTGSNQLHSLSAVSDLGRVYVRVLPVAASLEKCQKAGLKPSQIVAMQGPFTKEMNKAMLKFLDVEIMVTKESSNVGGFLEKLEAGVEEGCKVLVIERPSIEYSNKIENMDQLIKEIERKIGF